MRSAAFALLAGLAAAVAAAPFPAALPQAEQRLWVALPAAAVAAAEAAAPAHHGAAFSATLARRFDVRYSHDGLAVAVLSPEQLARLPAAGRRHATVLGEYLDGDRRPIFVLEPNPDRAVESGLVDGDVEISQHIRTTAADAVAHGAELLYLDPAAPRHAVIRMPLDAVNKGYILPNERLVQDVPVALVAQDADPPVFEGSAASHVVPEKGVIFDPLVKAVIGEVSQANIRRIDSHLSEAFFTRLSTTPDARLAEKWLFNQYSSIKGLEVSTFQWNPNHASNVIATLKGKVDPTKFVVVGAHFDDRSFNITDPNLRAPGADDNASGSSAVLEFARILAETPIRFAYSIMFCAFSGEEQGLLGSRAYAAHLKDNDVEVVAMLNADMLGYHAPNDSIALGMKNRYVTPWLLERSFEITRTYTDLPVGESNSCCSDYQSFFEYNYPSIGFFESLNAASNNPNYHQTSDSKETVDFTQIAREAAAMLATVTTFAGPVDTVVVHERNGTVHWRFGDQAPIPEAVRVH